VIGQKKQQAESCFLYIKVKLDCLDCFLKLTIIFENMIYQSKVLTSKGSSHTQFLGLSAIFMVFNVIFLVTY